MSSRYLDYYATATRHVEMAEAAIVRQELNITRLRMYGLDTSSAEEMLKFMREHHETMRDDQYRFEEQLRALGLLPTGDCGDGC